MDRDRFFSQKFRVRVMTYQVYPVAPLDQAARQRPVAAVHAPVAVKASGDQHPGCRRVALEVGNGG